MLIKKRKTQMSLEKAPRMGISNNKKGVAD